MTNETVQVAIIMGSDSDLPVVDASFSILPEQLKNLCEECHTAYKATLSNKLQRSTTEKSNKIFRRSIYFVRNLKNIVPRVSIKSL